jgi:hypothetical protein
MNAIGDYYLTLRIVDQMSRLANGQPHVAEDELVFVDAQGTEVGRGDVRVELRDEQGNINRNYEYVFDEEVEIDRTYSEDPRIARYADTGSTCK